MTDIVDSAELRATIQEAISIAIKYRNLTGKPLTHKRPLRVAPAE